MHPAPKAKPATGTRRVRVTVARPAARHAMAADHPVFGQVRIR
jgi:hypothetical protein